MTYYRQCVKGQINPDPTYISQIKDRCLRIETGYMSTERCQALKELLVQGALLEKPEYQIEQLVVDEGGMDDEKLAIILEALLSQPGKHLKRLHLRNCEVKAMALGPLLRILERPAPYHLDELRLVNLKGLDALQMKITA